MPTQHTSPPEDTYIEQNSEICSHHTIPETSKTPQTIVPAVRKGKGKATSNTPSATHLRRETPATVTKLETIGKLKLIGPEIRGASPASMVVSDWHKAKPIPSSPTEKNSGALGYKHHIIHTEARGQVNKDRLVRIGPPWEETKQTPNNTFDLSPVTKVGKGKGNEGLTNLAPNNSFIPSATGANKSHPVESPDPFDLSPTTRVEPPASTKRAEDVSRKRKELAKQKVQIENTLRLGKEAEAQLLEEAAISQEEKDKDTDEGSDRGFLKKHSTYDFCGSPGREKRKHRNRKVHLTIREDRANDKRSRHKWIAREEAHIGGFTRGEPGFTPNHSNLGNDIATHNVGLTTPPHDKPAKSTEYAQDLPQAQSERLYSQQRGSQTKPKLPVTRLPLPSSQPHTTPKGPRASAFGLKDIIQSLQLRKEIDTIEQKVSRTQVIINGLPPSTRTEQWKEELTEAFNQKAEELEFNHGIEVDRVNTIASYPTEVVLMVNHREGLLGEDLILDMRTLQEEINLGNTASIYPRVSHQRNQ